MIRGAITDSVTGHPIELATAAIIDMSDSSLYAYTVSDSKGVFTLQKLVTSKTYKLIISDVGYQTFKQVIQFSPGTNKQLLTVQLKQLLYSLNEVSIHGEGPPVTIRKDTIEFIAEAFKTRPNAVVEELLKKLPGVQVYQDGTIYVNGKKVKRILLNGKDFFGTDTKIAARNLNADIVDKIQITSDREDDPNMLLNDNEIEKVIDLKLKSKIKKSLFGKLHGAVGTESRYDIGGILNIFRDTLQISLVGFSNNTNQSSFSLGDLKSMGGFDRSGVNSFHINDKDQVTGINGITLGGEGSGVQTINSGGFNINNDYGNKLKVNIQDFFTHTSDINTITSIRRQFLNDSVLNSQSNSNILQEDFVNILSGKLKWQPGKTTLFQFTPQLTLNKSTNNTSLQQTTLANTLLLNNVSNIQNGKNNRFNYRHTLYLNQKTKKEGEIFTVSQQFSIGPGNDHIRSTSNSLFYPAVYPDTTIEVRNRKTFSTAMDLNTTYRRSFNKHVTLILGTSSSFSNRSVSVTTPLSTPIYNLPIDSSGYNAFHRSDLINSLREGAYIVLSKKTNVELMLAEQIQSSKNSLLFRYDQQYFNFLPSLKFNSGTFDFNYTVSVNQPGINDLEPVANLTTPLYVYTGNPYLKPSYDHNINTSYFKYYSASEIVINAYINVDFIRNDIISKIQIDSSGVQKIKPVNKTGTENLVLGTSLAKNFKKKNGLEVKVNSTMYLGYQKNPIEVNNDVGSRKQYSFTLIQRVDMNWKDIILLIPEYRIISTINSYSNVNYDRVDFIMHRLNAQLVVNLSKKFTIESNYIFLSNPDISGQLSKTINLFNAAASYRFLKEKRAELKLAVYDLFNQNVNVSRTVNQDYILDTQTMVLKRYVSLGMIFNIARTTKNRN